MAAAETKAALRDALARLRGGRQVAALQQLSSLAPKLSESLAFDAGKAVLKVILDALDSNANRKLSSSVANVVSGLAKSYGGEVASVIVAKYGDATGVNVSPAAWAARCAVLAACLRGLATASQSVADDVLAKLAKALFGNLARVYASGNGAAINAADNACRRAVLSERSLTKRLLVLAAAGLDTDDATLAALRLLLGVLATAAVLPAAAAAALKSVSGNSKAAAAAVDITSASFTADLLPALHEAAARLLFAPTARPTSGTVASLAPILATTDSASWAAVFAAPLSRSMKQKTEATLPLLTPVLAAARVDVSAALDDLFVPILVAQASSAKDEVRAAVVSATAAVLSRCGTAAASAADATALVTSATKLVTGFTDILTKKKASVPLWQARQGLLQALGAAAMGAAASPAYAVPGAAAGLAKLGTEVAAFAIGYAPKETNDTAKASSVLALGSWLPLLVGAGATSLPADVASFFAAGLKASQPAVADGFAEALYRAVVTDCAVGEVSGAGAMACRAIAASEQVVEGLLDLVTRTAAAALAVAGKKQLPAPVSAIYAYATLLRLGHIDAGVASKLAQPRISGAAPSAAAATASPTASAAAAKKPAATTATAAKPKAAAPPTGPAASAAAAGGAGGASAKSYDFFDLLTVSALAPAVLYAPALLTIKSRAELEAAEPVLHAVVDAVSCGLLLHAEQVKAKAYGKVLVPAVIADCKGATAGDPLVDAAAGGAGGAAAAPATAAKPDAASGAGAGAGAAAPAAPGKTRTPGAAFIAIVSLLAHPLPEVRRKMCTAVTAAYALEAHALLPLCLLHALWDRVKSSDVLAPSASAHVSAQDTGVGDGPAAANAVVAALATGGRMAGASATADAGADGGAGSADSVAVGALPAPHLLRAALLSVLPVGVARLPIDTEAALGPALFLCCHPAVVGGEDDATGRSRTGAAALIGAASADAASLVNLLSSDKRQKLSCIMWRNVYRALCKAAGYSTTLSTITVDGDAADGSGTPSTTGGAGSAAEEPVLIAHRYGVSTGSVDTLLQQEPNRVALLAHLRGYSGIWSPSHTLRVTASRMAGMLMRGVAWIATAEPTTSSDAGGAFGGAFSFAFGPLPGVGAGGRDIIISGLLPVLLDALHECTEAGISSADADVWRTRDGTLYTGPVGEGEGEAELRRKAEAEAHRTWQGGARTRRSARTQDSLDVSAHVDEPWLATLEEELESRKREAAADAALREAMGTSKGKGGFKGGMSMAPPPGAKGRGGPAGKSEEEAAALKEQAATRSRVQAVYAKTVAALHTLRRICTSAPHAVQPSVPHLLPALLPCLASPIVAGHAALTTTAVLSAALLKTVAAADAAQPGLLADWLRALQVVQGGSDIHGRSSSHGHSQGRGAGGGVSSLSAADEDSTGLVGANLSKYAPVLRRLLQKLCPLTIPRSGPGHIAVSFGVPNADADAPEFGSDDAVANAQVHAATGPLPPAAIHLLFPVLRAILTASPPLPILQPALALLSVHVSLPVSVASDVDAVLMRGNEADLAELAESSASAAAAVDTLALHPEVVEVQLSASHKELLPLGPSISEGSAAEYGPAGVLHASRLLSSHASIVATAPRRSKTASTSRVAPYGTATTQSDSLSLRLLRASMARTLLYILRSAPRSSPQPDTVLLQLVRGGQAAASTSSYADEDEDDDEEGAGVGGAPAGTRTLTFTVGETRTLVGQPGLLSGFAHVRSASLAAVDIVLATHAPASGMAPLPQPNPAPEGSDAKLVALTAAVAAARRVRSILLTRLFVSIQDEDEDNAAYAKMMWSRHNCKLSADYATSLIPLLSHPEMTIRNSAAKAVQAAMELHPSTTDATLKQLLATFSAWADPSAVGLEGAAHTRAGVVASLAAAAEQKRLPVPTLPIVLPFLIQKGLPDTDDTVREGALNAGRALVDAYGASHTRMFLPVLETFLEQGAKSPLAAPGEAARDAQREGVVVLLGSAAKYLAPTDPKVKSILNTLIATLNTPSEAVQRAVGQCLPPLAKMTKADAPGHLATTLEKLTKNPNFAVRRGAAFGLAGLVRGFGLSCLKTQGVMTTVELAVQDKQDIARQGGLFAIETMCEALGNLFEPYVPRLLPLLLKSFGDGSGDVREAANYASKAVMAMLTGHGVKIVMPAVLKGLAESAWRSKHASIQLLGNMAYCAPKQLSACLPMIVPRLVEAFEDPHPRVQGAGKESLQDIGKVIKNPEIIELVPLLISALTDPTNKTKDALTSLAETDFVHAVDAASLALIVPIIRRALGERTTGLKCQGAIITGNMCSLVADPRDLLPYLPALMPALKKVAVDPIPDVRTVTARAFGSLVNGIGVEQVPDLIPWLIDTLQSEASTVERSGGAQGLVEVLVAAGDERMTRVLADLLLLQRSNRPGAREGLLWLMVFLPATLGHSFARFINRCMPVVIQGLADDVEGVRDVAIRSGKVIVKQHALTDSAEILPSLENGLLSPSWRIRQCSITLVSELLSEISGTHAPAIIAGNVEEIPRDEDDEDAWSEESEEEEELPLPLAAPAAPAADAKGGKGKGKGAEEAEEKGKATAEAAAKFLKDKKGAKGGAGGGAAEAPADGGKGDAQPEKKRKKGERGNAEDREMLAINKARAAKAAKQAAAAQEEDDADEQPEEDPYSMAAMDQASSAHIRVLGVEARNRLLASLYLVRSDTSNVVRQAALNSWKQLVVNTPKTMREVLPALMRLVIALLSGENEERRVVAGRCLGEVVHKLGDRVLPEIVPILRHGLQSESGPVREGVCLGLAEVIEAATKSQISGFLNILVPAVRDALCDSEPQVREAAARAFNTLQRVIGQQAADAVVPSLLAAVDTDVEEDRVRAIAGLQNILAVRSKEILPALVPKLTHAPLSVFHARALAAVAQVTGNVLHYHWITILPALVAALAGDEKGAPASGRTEEAVSDRLNGPLGAAAATIICSVQDVGVPWTLQEVCKVLAGPVASHRRVAAWLLSSFVRGTTAPYASQVPMLLKELLSRFADEDTAALRAAWDAVNTMVNTLPIEDTVNHLDFIRSVLSSVVADVRMRQDVPEREPYYLPGFCLPKGLDAILPVHLRALMHGSADARESAALGLGELVSWTSHDALKAFYVKITGPLIRIVADKFPWNVKAAILSTLALIIERGGAALKPFQPQLQQSFVKALLDPTQAVRSRGASALARLMPLSTRIDPLLTELCTGATTNAGGIQESFLEAAALVLYRAADRITAPVRGKAVEVAAGLMEAEDETLRRLAAAVVGAAMRMADAGTIASTLSPIFLTPGEEDDDDGGVSILPDSGLDGRVSCIAATLKYAPAAIPTASLVPSLITHLQTAAKATHAAIREQAARGIGYALAHAGRSAGASASGGAGGAAPAAASTGSAPDGGPAINPPEPLDFVPEVIQAYRPAVSALAPVLAALLGDQNADVRKRAVDACRRCARHGFPAAKSQVAVLLPPLTAIVNRDTPNLVLRVAADRALLHWLQVRSPAFAASGPPAAILAGVDSANAQFLTEYARKALRKAAEEESDDEDPDVQ